MVLVIACGGLLVLIFLLGLATERRAVRLVAEVSAMNASHKSDNRVLYSIRANLHLSGVLVRDFLLDPSHLRTQAYRGQLVELRESMERQLSHLDDTADDKETTELESLRRELSAYWESLDPLFEWTPEQKLSMSSFFLNRVVLPRGAAVLAITREIEGLSNERLRAQEAELAAKQAQFTDFVYRVTLSGLLLGFLIAISSALIIRRLERQTQKERARSESAELQLRELSRDLVGAQEQERKRLARELHDEVGQMLTALGMELRKAEKLKAENGSALGHHLNEARKLIAVVLRSVRSISMGLRPSMLDDLGLREAIDWQLREFERRYGIVTSLVTEGSLDDLTDNVRTCVYRVVQEALTNCARHANATNVKVRLTRNLTRLSVSVVDDGSGIEQTSQKQGFGLLSMEERVRDLHGILSLKRIEPAGTELSAEIPILGVA